MRISPAVLVAMAPLLIAVAAVRLSPAGGPVAPIPSDAPSTAPSGVPTGPASPAELGVEIQALEWAIEERADGTPVAGVIALIQIADGRPSLGIDPATSEVVLYDAAEVEIARGGFTVAIPRRLDPGVHVGLAAEFELPAGAVVARAELTRIGVTTTLNNYAPAGLELGALVRDGAVLRLPATLSAPTGATADAAVEGYTLFRDATGAPVALFLLGSSPMGGVTRSVDLLAPAPGVDPADPGIGVESAYAVRMP